MPGGAALGGFADELMGGDGMFGRGDEESDTDPADYRYVDEKFEPLAASQLRNAASQAIR